MIKNFEFPYALAGKQFIDVSRKWQIENKVERKGYENI